MLDPLSRTRYYPDLHLEIWRPRGELDYALTAQIVSYIGFQERIRDELFNRFTDLSEITDIRLNFDEVLKLADERCAAYAGRPPVKSAFLSPNAVGFGVARMFATLMDQSPIQVNVFRELDSAAQWLGVPVEVLSARQ
jgi:hypothetical protein